MKIEIYNDYSSSTAHIRRFRYWSGKFSIWCKITMRTFSRFNTSVKRISQKIWWEKHMTNVNSTTNSKIANMMKKRNLVRSLRVHWKSDKRSATKTNSTKQVLSFCFRRYCFIAQPFSRRIVLPRERFVLVFVVDSKNSMSRINTKNFRVTLGDWEYTSRFGLPRYEYWKNRL